MVITLETVLVVVIVLITLNLLLVGFYILKVLREAYKTIKKAQVVIDDVDVSIKDGVEKMKAMEKPLNAMAITSEAVTGVFKTAGLLKRRIGIGKNVDEVKDIRVTIPVSKPKPETEEIMSTTSISGGTVSIKKVDGKTNKASRKKFFKKK